MRLHIFMRGGASEPQEPSTDQVPDAPVVDFVQSSAASTDDEFTLYWSLPDGDLTAQTLYYDEDPLEARAGPSGSATAVSLGSAVTSHNVTGLSGGVTLYVAVTATNAIGEGEPSSLFEVTIT